MFKNDKGENQARPDYTGTVTLEGGKEMRMAAWVREAKSGVKYLSGRLSEPQVQASDAGTVMQQLKAQTYHSNTGGL